MLHALHSACLSHVWLRRRPPSKNNRNVLKISYIKGKYLGNRYLPLVFCAYSACSKCRIRGQNQGKCFPKIRSVFPKLFICFPKNSRCFPKFQALKIHFSRPECLFGNLENWGCASLNGFFPAILNQLRVLLLFHKRRCCPRSPETPPCSSWG